MDQMALKQAYTPQRLEVVVVSSDTVRQIQMFVRLGWGAKRIASELGISRNTVRRYVRMGETVLPLVQARRRGRRLDEAAASEASTLLRTQAAGNAVVVQRLLAMQGVAVGLRTVQRAVEATRKEQRRAAVATVRFETPPGEQLQIDFGQKLVQLGDKPAKTRVFFLVGVLGYSRRCFVRLSLNERIEEWQSGVAEAFAHFGGVTKHILIDNPKAMMLSHHVQTRAVTLNPAFAAFARDWGIAVRACAPYRARTKGKTESGVKYFKRNALADLSFVSYAALEAHTAAWLQQADVRVHGTTHEVPLERYLAAEKAALRPLPVRPASARLRRLKRKVANDCLVNVDTIRYSVPHRYVAEHVEVGVREHTVHVYLGEVQIAQHQRCFEPHAVVKNSSHYDGLLRRHASAQKQPDACPQSDSVKRPLSVYNDIVNAGGSR